MSIFRLLKWIILASVATVQSQNVLAEQITKVAVADPSEPQSATLKYSTGDKLKVSFYERLGREEDKWANVGQTTKPDRSFYLHPEISGEYTVQADWSISFPLIGNVGVANRDAKEVEADLASAFEKLVGRPAFVNIALVEREPIYVVGPVKRPGSYKFESGITPLHVVALAGGLQRNDEDRWAVVEALRNSGKLEAATNRLKSVLAQYAVLRAELDGTPVSTPAQLAKLAGADEAQRLIANEQEQRAAIVKARNERQHVLLVAVESAQQAVDIDRSRLVPLQENVQMRQNRADGMRSLFMQGTINKLHLMQAQSELSDVEDRKANAQSSLAEDQHRLSLAKAETTKLKIDTNNELAQEITARQREIKELSPNIAASAGLLNVLKPDGPSDENVQFEIVRRFKVIAANDTTPLQPGDLVRIRLTGDGHGNGMPSDTDEPAPHKGRNWTESGARPASARTIASAPASQPIAPPRASLIEQAPYERAMWLATTHGVEIAPQTASASALALLPAGETAVPGRTSPPAAPAVGTASAAPAAASRQPSSAAERSAPAAPIDESRLSEVERVALLERGDALLSAADVTSARLFYERAAGGGDGLAAVRLGETFDPIFLDRARLRGVRGDLGTALSWYRRARDLGATDAEILLKGLEAK
jgi:protein involved in polysaccharide export with SLBB domain